MNRLTLLTILVFFLSCEKFEPKLDNILDSDNQTYVRPTVQIDSGPLDGGYADTPFVSFSWSGNELVSEYRHNWFSIVINPNDWSNWSTQTSSPSCCYNENTILGFAVQSRYVNEDTSSIEKINFTIDAVKGPAIIIYPIEQSRFVDDIAIIDVIAEEVTDLSAAEFSIVYESNSLDVVSIDQGDIFMGLGNVLFLSEESQSAIDTIIITTAVWGDSNPSFNGSGVLAKIQFKILVNGIHSVNIDSDAVLRDYDNNEMSVSEVRGGKIYAQ